MKKPLIGIVLDRETNGDYSDYPYFVLREDYFVVIAKAGGIPIGLDLNIESIAEYVERLDGLLLPGGDYDIPPDLYGDMTVHDTVVTKTERLDYDIALTKAFMEADKPILGICVGLQLLAVLSGGSLVQDIESEMPDSLDHYVGLRTEFTHEVAITEGSKLHSILSAKTLHTNSHHHQAVKNVGDGWQVNAVAPDGVIEGIESLTHYFCIGLEWHPEFLVDDQEIKIFESFVAACNEKATQA